LQTGLWLQPDREKPSDDPDQDSRISCRAIPWPFERTAVA